MILLETFTGMERFSQHTSRFKEREREKSGNKTVK